MDAAPLKAEKHRGIVISLLGNFRHGETVTYPAHRDKLLSTGNTMNDRLASTRKMAEKISNASYAFIEIWEREFDEDGWTNADLKKIVEECDETLNMQPLDPRDSFFGGRIRNHVKVVDFAPDEQSRYYDFYSLYPFINKRGVYCIGHPEIFVAQHECEQLVGRKKDISKVQELIMCDVFPPQNLYFGILPLKMHGKLLFSSCRKCCEEKFKDDCPQQDEKVRSILSTWVSLEVQKAVEMKYKMLKILEIWQYQTTQYNQ